MAEFFSLKSDTTEYDKYTMKFFIMVTMMTLSSPIMAQSLVDCLANQCIWESDQFECRAGLMLEAKRYQGRLRISPLVVKKNTKGLFEVYSENNASYFLFDNLITTDKETELYKFTALMSGGSLGNDVKNTEVSKQKTVNGIVNLTNLNTKSVPQKESFTYDQSSGKLTLEVKHRNKILRKCEYRLTHAQTNHEMFDYPGLTNSSSRENNNKADVPATSVPTNADPASSKSSPQ